MTSCYKPQASIIFQPYCGISSIRIRQTGISILMWLICITQQTMREDLIGHGHPFTPSILNYKLQADNGSMLNTPPTYNWYLLGLVLEWIKEQGGISAIEARNSRKADKLYAAIDAPTFYSNPVDPSVRLRMNVPFLLAKTELEKDFLAQAKWHGLVNLEGHRSVGTACQPL